MSARVTEVRIDGGVGSHTDGSSHGPSMRAERRLSDVCSAGDAQRIRGGDEDFLLAMDAFAQAVRRARGAPPRAGDRALTLSQYALIQPLAQTDGIRVRELATQAGITASTATRILDALERRQIVTRTRASDDRRAVGVTLTELGRDVLGDQDEWMRGRQRTFYESLPTDERALAPDLLVRLAALVDEMAAGPPE